MSRRGAPRGLSRVQAGVIAIVVILVGCYLGFTKDIPFTKPFEVDAVFRSANSIRPGSVVRIAGVNVGKVKAISAEPGTDASVVTMQIDDRGLPLHNDATAKIRPRIFLEGNFFVDLRPGTPDAPTLDSGDTIKITQTSTPVQLDQVLTALQDTTRSDLKTLLAELAQAEGGRPHGPHTQTAAEALNDAYEDLGPAEKSTAEVNQALLGSEPGRDLQRLLRGFARTSEGLGRNEAQLKDLVTNLNTTMGAFASEQGALRASIRVLGPTLRNANAAFAELNAAFPPTRAFAREILPGVRETPATIAAAFPWIDQTRKLIAPSELRGLATDLRPTARDLAQFVDSASSLSPQADRLARCVADVLLPTGDVPIQDEFTTGQPNYREFAYTLVGLAGEGANSDGNGSFVHFQPGGGSTTVRLGEKDSPSGVQYANAFPGLATRPAKPSSSPRYVTSTPCYKSARPDLNGPAAARGPFGTVVSGSAGRRRAVRELRDDTKLERLRAKLRPFGVRKGVR